ncbi:MAG: ABC transporter ATP-binding protein [Planctomycetota bacterium]
MDAGRVRLTDVSKVYEVWTDPMARLKAPIYRRAAARAGQGRLASWLHARARACEQRVEALKPVSLEVNAGEAFGVLGRNGSGKSTLLQIAAGTLRPTTGSVDVKGRIAALLQLGSGFNPMFTGRENVFLNAAVLGVSRPEVKKRLGEVLEFAEIGDFIDRPMRTYSSGMRMRLAFAVQVMLDPSVLIIDEALAVGDVFFQQKCFARLKDLLAGGTCVLFVSHSTRAVTQFCDRAMVLERGNCLFTGESGEAAKVYQDSMQRAMLSAPVDSSEDEALANLEASKSNQSGRVDGGEVEEDAFEDPSADAWIPVPADAQLGTGNARVARIAVCDRSGAGKRAFEQGQTANVHYEIEALRDIPAPSVGVSLRDRRGETIHAKHLIQTGRAGPSVLRAGRTIVVKQTLKLALVPGDYTLDAAIISVPESCWEGDRIISHEFNQGIVRHAWTQPIVPISVTFRKRFTGHFATHFGIADLPGKVFWRIRDTGEASKGLGKPTADAAGVSV